MFMQHIPRKLSSQKWITKESKLFEIQQFRQNVIYHGCCRLVDNSDVKWLDQLLDVMIPDIHMFSAALIVAIVNNIIALLI